MNKRERNEYIGALSTMALIGAVLIALIIAIIKSMMWSIPSTS